MKTGRRLVAITRSNSSIDSSVRGLKVLIVVHQDVDVAPGLEELPHASFEADGIGNIQLTEPGAGSGCSLGSEDGIEIAEDHFISLPGKGLDDSLSDSVGTARNEYASFHGLRIFPQR
jgi:hypothetical protein